MGSKGTFRMPLNADDEAFFGLDGLKSAVLWYPSHGPKAITRRCYSLMMAAIYPRLTAVKRFFHMASFRGKFNCVRFCNRPSGSMIDHCFEMLHKCSSPPHVHRLVSVADTQNRLVQVEGIL